MTELRVYEKTISCCAQCPHEDPEHQYGYEHESWCSKLNRTIGDRRGIPDECPLRKVG